MKLSARDWEVLQQALDNPPEPNDKLRQAMRAVWDRYAVSKPEDDELLRGLK